MELNKYIVNLYLQSEEVINLKEYFINFEEKYRNHDIGTLRKIYSQFSMEDCNDDFFSLHMEDAYIIKSFICRSWPSLVSMDKLVSLSNAERLFEKIESAHFLNEEGIKTDKKCFNLDQMEELSSALFMISNEYFIPYYFNRHFFCIQNIFHEIGIDLLPVPKRTQEKERFLYYFQICKSLYLFRVKLEISGVEMACLLYGFLLKVINKTSFKASNIKPMNCFFTGAGGEDDFYFLDNATVTTVTNWSGSPDAQPGDIVLMYCISPRSYIHSIWRVVAPGSVDPFFLYYKNVWIGEYKKIPSISLNEMRSNYVLAGLPLIKQKMQNIIGRKISKLYYDEILKIIKTKGFDIDILPKIEQGSFSISNEILNEKDVEAKLLEPLLLKLRFKESDWKRQMIIRMGRGEKVYPDYVVFPKFEKGNESGYWVWEAKYKIESSIQLKKDINQAKSYALRLRSKGLGVISIDGIWLLKSPFDFKDVLHFPWVEIQEQIVFSKIFEICGNKKKL